VLFLLGLDFLDRHLGVLLLHQLDPLLDFLANFLDRVHLDFPGAGLGLRRGRGGLALARGLGLLASPSGQRFQGATAPGRTLRNHRTFLILRGRGLLT